MNLPAGNQLVTVVGFNKTKLERTNMIRQTIMLLLIGFTSGTLSGLVGVGGGIIIVPALIFFLGFSQQFAQGTSLGLLFLPVGILAVFNYYRHGFIDWEVIAIMCVAFAIGGWLGSRFALSVPESITRKLFALLLFYTGIRMAGWDVIIYKWIREIS
jgi:uncharacterized membrane protein YfcA